MLLLARTLTFALLAFVAGCGSDETIQGRYVNTDGLVTYQFQSDGSVRITTDENVISALYDYDKAAQRITLESDRVLPTQALTINDNGNLESDGVSLYRGVDETMLAESTWIGEQGQYVFGLTFTETDKGLETFSELVSYYDDDMTYVYQTDDSITRLTGNKLFLDKTEYTVSEVTDTSLKLSIGGKSMVIHKYPKGSPIKFLDGYINVDDE